MSLEPTSNTQALWDKFHTIVTDLMQNYIPTKTLNGKKIRKPWVNRKVKSQMRRRNKLFRRMRKTKNVRGSRNFRQKGGGGGPGQSNKNKSLTFFCFFLVFILFYRNQMVNFKEIYRFQGSRGGPTFSRMGGGSNFFQGVGVQLLIPYRNPYNL